MHEDRSTIGLLENSWSNLGMLSEKNGMLHKSGRSTQPWNTGLPIDFVRVDKFEAFSSLRWLSYSRRKAVGDYSFPGRYKTHPDKNQEDLFFALLLQCFDDGTVSGDMVQHEMLLDRVRKDAPGVISGVPSVDQVIAALPA
jgi:hypothetical protein